MSHRSASGGKVPDAQSLKKDPLLETLILALVAPHTAGDPMSDQKWLNWRLSDLRQRLDGHGHRVSKPVISRILRAHGYSLRANLKQAAGTQHPERDQQFRYIRMQRTQHSAANQPVISVDTKKKELVGNFKNAGQIWCQTAEEVDAHDFPHDALGQAVPYGIDDVRANCGTVSIGQSADTPTFAVDNLAHWCQTELHERYPHATQLLIEADSGGSNGARSRVWKQQLQVQLAHALGLTVTVCYQAPKVGVCSSGMLMKPRGAHQWTNRQRQRAWLALSPPGTTRRAMDWPAPRITSSWCSAPT